MSLSSLEIRELAESEVHPLPEGDEAQGPFDAFRQAFTARRSRPEWCFAAKVGGQTVGLLGFRAPDAHGDLQQTPETMILFFLEADPRYLKIGQALLQYGLVRLRSLGVSKLRWNFESGDFWSEALTPETRWPERLELARRIGMSLRQEKVAYSIRLSEEPPAGVLDGWGWRTLEEVGEPAYIEAIRTVMQGTLDRKDADACRRLDPGQAARRFFADIRDEMEYEPRVWKLGYASTGGLAGVVAPLKMWGDLGTLGYIGVVPEQRGRGWAMALLRRGHADLFAEGITRIVADTDALNVPMQRAFEKAGYRYQGRSWAFELEV